MIGVLSVEGGNGHSSTGGGGGGGLLAVYHESGSVGAASLSAKGGDGVEPGAAGIVYIKNTASSNSAAFGKVSDD